MKKIVITGAAGTVGQQLVKLFEPSVHQYSIFLFDRKTSRNESFLKKAAEKFSVFYGDISDYEDVENAFYDADIVIHLAAIIPPLADENPVLTHRVNVLGTQNIITCLEKNSPNAFLLYSSSISVYGDRIKNPNILVSDALIPSEGDEYARTKIQAEKIIQESKLRWSIFRLTAIMGFNNHKKSSLMFHMPLETKMEIATPQDAARAFCRAIKHFDELEGKIFNLSGGKHCRITYSDFMKRSFKISGLGEFEFENKSFAERNFHCGYYLDGDILNEILDFRRHTIDDYFKMLEKSISSSQLFFTKILRKMIIRKLQDLSEPLKAVKENNEEEIKHYFYV